MHTALMRIISVHSSNESLIKDPSQFNEFFDTAWGALLGREKDGSPEDVIKSIKSLQSLTGRFKDIRDLFDPDLLAASLIKQDTSAKFISDSWHPVFCGYDQPEAYYYILWLDRARSNWLLTYWDPYEKSKQYFFINLGLEVMVTGCHPDIWAGEKKILG